LCSVKELADWGFGELKKNRNPAKSPAETRHLLWYRRILKSLVINVVVDVAGCRDSIYVTCADFRAVRADKRRAVEND